MLNKVSIVPINGMLSEQSLPTAYQWKNKLRMLMEDDSYVEVDLVEQKDKPRPHERIIRFNRNQTELNYTYYDEGDRLHTAMDKVKILAIKSFWANHPMCQTNGVSIPGVTKHPMFNIVNFTDKSIGEIKSWKNKLIAANKVNEMSSEEKLNLCYYYGVPKGKTENEMTLLLGNFSNGICLQDNEIDAFIKIFVKNEESDKDLIVMCRKAIAFDIITSKSYEGKDSYYLGETFIGTSFSDIIAYCKREEKTYEDFIVRQVMDKTGKKSTKPTAAENKPSEVKINETPSILSDEIKSLQKQAKSLKSEGHIWKGFAIDKATVESLKSTIHEAEAKKKVRETKPSETREVKVPAASEL